MPAPISIAQRFLNWRTIARLVLFALVVWVILVQVRKADLSSAFLRLKLWYLVPVILVFSPLGVVLRALRWRVLLPGGERLPLVNYIRAYILGILANSVLLSKLGDLAKAKAICNNEVTYGRSLAVVLIDRLLEAMALLLLFSGVLVTSALPVWATRLAGVVGLAGIGALVGLRIAFRYREKLLKTVRVVLRSVPDSVGSWLLRFTERLLEGCAALTDHRRVAIAMLYALAVWSVEILMVATFLAAFSIPAPKFVAATVILMVLNFGTLVPISPSSVGVYQLLCAFALSLWGIDRGLSLSLGIVMQTVLFVPLYSVGLIWILVAKWNRSEESPSPSLAE